MTPDVEEGEEEEDSSPRKENDRALRTPVFADYGMALTANFLFKA